jgi:hypothetical protein
MCPYVNVGPCGAAIPFGSRLSEDQAGDVVFVAKFDGSPDRART